MYLLYPITKLGTYLYISLLVPTSPLYTYEVTVQIYFRTLHSRENLIQDQVGLRHRHERSERKLVDMCTH